MRFDVRLSPVTLRPSQPSARKTVNSETLPCPQETFTAGVYSKLPQSPQPASDAPSQAHSQTDHQLTSGRSFERGLARQVSQILGFPLSLEGLEKVYQGTVPGAQARVVNPRIEEGMFGYDISWRDHVGEEIAHVSRFLGKRSDNSLELARCGAYVRQDARGEALSQKVMQREIEFLRKASSHPQSSITIMAGDFKMGDQSEKLGAYTWARFGFDFNDQPSELPLAYPPRSSDDDGSKSNRQLLQEKFRGWVDERFTGQARQSLLDLAAHLEHPWQVANLAIDGIQVEEKVGSKTVQSDVGKAFMLSESCPCWRGEYRVNDPEFPGEPVRARFLPEQLERASRKADELQKRIKEQLDSDPMVALHHLKSRGDNEWLQPLRMLALRKPEIRQQIEHVIECIQGKHFRSGLQNLTHSVAFADFSSWQRTQWLSQHDSSSSPLAKLQNWASQAFYHLAA